MPVIVTFFNNRDLYSRFAAHTQPNWQWRGLFQIVRPRENHKKRLERYIWTLNWPSATNFKIVLLQLAWFVWLFDASLVSGFVFWCGNPGCALMDPHTCACNVCIISRFVISWQFRRIDHIGSQSPYLFCPPSSCTYMLTITWKWKFSCVLYAHSKFLCSSASFKLSSLSVRHPSRIPSLLNCYSTKHSRRFTVFQMWTPLTWHCVLLPCFDALPDVFRVTV